MPKDKDLISVIIPVYNVERYLDRCIESVVNQDYRNIEIILVDDGSTDASSDICEKWKIVYPEIIRVIHQKNHGASLARKKGIEKALGTFITFVDSDDYISPRYISSLHSAAIDNEALLAVCPFTKVPVGKTFDFTQAAEYKNFVLSSDEIFRRFFKYEFWGFWGGIYHTLLFNNIIYPTATINEDYFVKAQIFSKVDKVGYCPESLYAYETHPGSLSQLKLSIRALGEFDNARNTWLHISSHKPNYEKHALAIVSEATCKWLGIINQTPKEEVKVYKDYKDKMRSFLHDNFCRVFSNKHLLWKIRLLLLLEYLKAI